MNKNIKKIGVAFLGAAMMTASVMPAFAANSTAANNNTATTNDLNNADIIDESKTGSLSIYKYDITSATRDGAYTEGDNKATGEADAELEDTMKNYAIEGVEFSYLRLGNVETYSVDTGTEHFVELVYEIPDGLRQILGLSEETTNDPSEINTSTKAVDMTDSKVAYPCSNTGVYHYTSQQLSNALKAILEADDVAAKDALENYMSTETGVQKMPLTNDKGYTHVENLPLGLYLVVESKVPEEVTESVNPWFVELPFTNTSAQKANEDGTYDKDADNGGQNWLYDMTCYPKNQAGNPTLDKMVRNAYSNSTAYADKNATVNSADTFEGATGFTTDKNSKNTPIVHNIETNVKADDTDDATYVANRGGYTADGVTAGEAKYSSDYTYSSSTTASEGDILDYILISKLPHISSTATYLSQYTFVDVLSEGIEYNEDVRIAFYHTEADAKANNTANADLIWGSSASGVNFLQNYADVTVDSGYQNSGKTSLTVSFTQAGLDLINGANPTAMAALGITTPDGKTVTSLSDFYMVVYYTATVNSDATAVLGDEGNPNDVVLTWERTSQGFYNTLEDRCYVYTYAIDLTKVFDDSQGDPTKVQFTLYDETDAYYVVANKTETKDGELVYYVTGKAASEDAATKFTPDANGVMIINGLEGDTYKLTEIKTDDGYSLLKDQITIDITTATREVTPAVCGYNGYVDGEKHEHTDACYAVDANGDRIQYTDSDGAVHDILVCGHTDADANGRTIGKTDMKDAGVVSGSATVDDVAADMSNYVINDTTVLSTSDVKSDIDSANAVVNMKITNRKSFLLPKTGGVGMMAGIVAGIVAFAAGCYYLIARKKKSDD